MRKKNYLWSFGCGGSGYTHCGGVASTNDFATKNFKTVFTMLAGSYFGDWDNQNNVLRAPLASNGMILANIWPSVPHWYLHHMGIGKPIGYAAKLSQNNSTEYVGYWGNRYIHSALMGDPSLCMNIVKPIEGLQIDSLKTAEVILSWQVPQDSIIGYNIYRSNSVNGDFVKQNNTLVAGTQFIDSDPLSGKNVYMVRSMKN